MASCILLRSYRDLSNGRMHAKVSSEQPYQWLTHWNVLATTMSIRLGGWPPVGKVGEDRVGGGLKWENA